MKTIKKYNCVFVLFFLMLLSSCKDDGWGYPPVITTFIQGETNEKGILEFIIDDDNNRFKVENGSVVSNLKSDTIYRWIGTFTVDKTIKPYTAELYRLQPTVSKNPISIDVLTDDKKKDPVSIQSITFSGKYINLVATVMVKEKAHVVEFLYKKESSGKLKLWFYHDRKGDKEAFPETFYFSIPLTKLGLSEGSNIDFILNTYKGERTYSFVY